jgi:uncharacterized membrane protein YphA (DoxX/SURF4 family)
MAPGVLNTRHNAYVASTVLAVIAFAGSGLANLVRVDHVLRDMAHLGYPAYFMTVLGTWKLLGALVIALPGLPRLKEWAYAGMFFDLTGAACSRAASGDGAAMVLVPLVIACVVALSWAARSDSRRLSVSEARSPHRQQVTT